MKRAVLGAFFLALMLRMPSAAVAGEAMPYALVPRSTVLQFCNACTEPAGKPEVLNGSFFLTPVDLAAGTHIEALTDLRWESPSFKITGAGFVQYDSSGRLQVEVKATINGEEMRLRSTRRQPTDDGFFRVVLATRADAPVGYLIVLTAKMEAAPVADRDFDGVGDEKDNCRALANSAQADRDFDGVGDLCDECPETPSHAPVNVEGCSIDQLCPCDSPRGGGAWNRGGYAKCVARALRDLRRIGVLSRSETGDAVRRAMHSGCGQTVIASITGPGSPPSTGPMCSAS